MSKMLSVVLLLVLSGTATAQRQHWPKVEAPLEDYKPFVYEAEYYYGGYCVRLINADVQTREAHAKFVANLKAAQEDLQIFELHLQTFVGRKISDLSFVEAVPALRLISLGGADYERSQVAELANLPKLKDLFISGSGWDKEALQALGKVQQVEGLRAQCVRMEWEHFPALANLQELDLGNSDFNDAGAKALQSCKSLERLHVYQTGLTDEGLLHLAKLESLKFIGLTPPHRADKDKPHVTKEGLENFAQLRPDVMVNSKRPGTPHPPKPPAPNAPGRGPQELAAVSSIQHALTKLSN